MQAESFTTQAVLDAHEFYNSAKSAAITKAGHADIKEIYPIDESAARLLAPSIWRLAPNGAAVMRAVPAVPFGETRILTMWGSWSACGTARCLHLHSSGQRGERFTFDGVLTSRGDSVTVHGLWRIGVRNVTRVDLFRFKLQRMSDEAVIAHTSELPPLLDYPRQAEDGSERLLSEPEEQMEGVPVPAKFDLALEVTIDDVKQMPPKGEHFDGALTISRVNSGQGLDIALSTIGDQTPGSSIWMTEERSGAKTPGVEVTARNGRLTVKISPSLQFRPMASWFVRHPSYPENMSQAIAESGEITLTVTHGVVEGTITAIGEVMEGTHPKSAYKASLSGKLAGSGIDAQGASAFGRRCLDGEWALTGSGRSFSLFQDQSRIHGKTVDEIELKGTASGCVAHVEWRKPGASSGHGFLAVSDASLMAGLLWSDDPAVTLQPIIAELSPAVREPSSEDDADALKWLGYDLAHAGKHPHAAKVLMAAVDYFQRQADASLGNPKALPNSRRGYLLSQAIPLTTVLDSAFRAGDYPLLVTALRRSLRLHHELSQASGGSYLFREQFRLFKGDLDGQINTLQLLAEAFERGRVMSGGAGVGIRLEPAPDAPGFRIAELTPGMPALGAGLTVDDILTEVDGVSVINVAPDEVVRRLLGEPGSRVTLVLRRNGEPIRVLLARKAFVQPERREKFVAALTELRNLVASEAENLRADASFCAKAMEEAGRESEEPTVVIEKGFEELLRLISNRRAALKKIQNSIQEFSRVALAGEPKALALFERFTDAMATAPGRGVGIIDLGRKEDELKRDPSVTATDKSALELSLAAYGVSKNVEVTLDGRQKNAEGARESFRKLKPPAEVAKGLRNFETVLERWRGQLVDDEAKIEAMDAAKGGAAFYSEYLSILAEFRSMTREPSQARQLVEQSLVASERARERALADLLASRQGQPHQVKVSGRLRSFQNAPAPTIAEIRRLALESESTILEYFLTEKELLIWVVRPLSQERIDAGEAPVELRHKSISSRPIEPRVEQLLHYMEDASLGTLKLVKDDETPVLGLLRGLYEDLISPVEDLLPSDPDQPLIIIPHRSLSFVPFAALASGKEKPGQPGGRRLIEDHSIAYAPSLSVLKLLKGAGAKSPLPAKLSLLAVVNPEFGPGLVDQSGRPFESLIDLEENVAHLKRFYDEQQSVVLTGKDATPDAVMANTPSRDVLLFLTHAEADNANPYESYVALAGRRMTIREFAAEGFDSRLVIFGACQTGRGSVNGDGVMGLSRMTLAAGAQNLLVTLWKVPHMETIQLIYAFHESWRQGKPMAAALRDAQIERLAANPEQTLLWAGFALYGG